MWALLNRTPYAADRTWVRDKDGLHLWIVAVKATYDFNEAGVLRLADEQPPPLLEPVYFGKPGQSSVRFDTDLAAPKPTTDVVINASAHAPGGRPAKTVEVAARIHNVHKLLLVHGPRIYWQSPVGLAPSEPQPFVQQPIMYEWAFGGSDTSAPEPQKHRIDLRNPVGRGVALRPASLVHQPAHRVEHPRAPGLPAGFGALASYWSPRLELAGTYDEAWNKSRRPLLPKDYDARAALCAPVDQRPQQHLRGGEGIALQNMTPHGTVAFALPTIRLEFMTHLGAVKERHVATLGTVVIEPDQWKISTIWQTSLAVGPRDLDALDATVITERSS